MPLTLLQTQAIAELAKHLYDYLPGSGYASVAASVGVGNHWRSGSKGPAITDLLARTLDNNPEKFCGLVLAVVREGLKYGVKTGCPLCREDISALNAHLVKVGFKIPDLWSPAFLASLPSSEKRTSEQGTENKSLGKAVRLQELALELLSLQKMPPQERGYAFERLLNALFKASELAPHASFRLVGEQIDGSLELDGFTYLIEARWQSAPANQADLLVLQGKVTGKALWSRGLFISYGGFSNDGLAAFSRGRPSSLIAMDGLDLHMVLEGKIPLARLLALKASRAARTGEIMVSAREFLT